MRVSRCKVVCELIVLCSDFDLDMLKIMKLNRIFFNIILLK